MEFIGDDVCILASPYWKKLFDVVNSLLGVNWGVIWTRQTAHGSASENPDREKVKQGIAKQLRESSGYLVVHPEGATTNGKALLQFNKFVFGLEEEIQPVALQIRIPFQKYVPITIDHLRDDFGSNLFWTFFQPVIFYEYTYLPRQKRREDESPEGKFVKYFLN